LTAGYRKLRWGWRGWLYGRYLAVNLSVCWERGMWEPHFRRVTNTRWRWAWQADSGPIGLIVSVSR